MNEKTRRVLRGALKLSESERDELVKAIRDYERKRFGDRKRVRENIEKALTGPLGGACPCCGR